MKPQDAINDTVRKEIEQANAPNYARRSNKQAYADRRAEVKRLMTLLQAGLEQFDEEIEHSNSWEYPGSMESVIAGLTTAASAVGALDSDEMDELHRFFS